MGENQKKRVGNHLVDGVWKWKTVSRGTVDVDNNPLPKTVDGREETKNGNKQLESLMSLKSF